MYFVLRDAQWQMCIASVNPPKRAWLIQLWPEEPGPRQNEVNVASMLLLAAILRDFWVVEEREKVFASSPLPNRIARRRFVLTRKRVLFTSHGCVTRGAPICNAARTLSLIRNDASILLPHICAELR